MTVGKVKWFNNEKKYGFILMGSHEVFVHFSAILKEGYKTLKKGQEVEFDLVQGPRGERALNVKVLPVRPPRTEKKPHSFRYHHTYEIRDENSHEMKDADSHE